MEAWRMELLILLGEGREEEGDSCWWLTIGGAWYEPANNRDFVTVWSQFVGLRCVLPNSKKVQCPALSKINLPFQKNEI